MNTNRIQTALRRGVGIMITLAPAVAAGDTKAYSGTFCEPLAGIDHASYGTYGIDSEQDELRVSCPIVRDKTGNNDMPEVRVEVYNNPTSDGPSCRVVWFKGNGGSNVSPGTLIRGQSSKKTHNSAGTGQLMFNADEYDASDSFDGITASVHLSCELNDGDNVYQYTVEEGLY